MNETDEELVLYLGRSGLDDAVLVSLLLLWLFEFGNAVH